MINIFYITMNDFVEFWGSLGYNKFFLVLMILTFAGHIIFLIYRGVILMSGKKQNPHGREEGVSVIITCSNKAELIRKNLEA